MLASTIFRTFQKNKKLKTDIIQNATFFFYLIWSLLYRLQYNIAALKPTPHLQTTLLWDQQLDQLFLRSLWGALVNPAVHAVVMVCKQHNVWPPHSSYQQAVLDKKFNVQPPVNSLTVTAWLKCTRL